MIVLMKIQDINTNGLGEYSDVKSIHERLDEGSVLACMTATGESREAIYRMMDNVRINDDDLKHLDMLEREWGDPDAKQRNNDIRRKFGVPIKE